MNRRNFIAKTGSVFGATALLPTAAISLSKNTNLGEWESVRAEFLLTDERIHMAQFLLSSHPAKVRKAINHYRKKLDENPSEYWHHVWQEKEAEVAVAAADYLGAHADEIALTDSTTMGLSMLYCGLNLRPDDEILTTTHDHYSTEKSLEFAVKRNGASINRVDLYSEASSASVDEILSRLNKAINPQTRIVAVTLVHSSTGVKLPIKKMSEVIRQVNANRKEAKRIYFCVDAVHGFGVENIDITDLGCDFLVAGTHKWLFGPRGTGIMWAKRDAWHMIDPIIPPFSEAYAMWMGVIPEQELSFKDRITPGGFHSFEYRWALKEAFEFHLELGKEKIQNRTYELNKRLKEAMQHMSHVKLHTPMTTELSAGINSFEVNGLSPLEVVHRLEQKNIIGSTTPYKIIYARLTPCILNTEQEVDKCISALESLH